MARSPPSRARAASRPQASVPLGEGRGDTGPVAISDGSLAVMVLPLPSAPRLGEGRPLGALGPVYASPPRGQRPGAEWGARLGPRYDSGESVTPERPLRLRLSAG